MIRNTKTSPAVSILMATTMFCLSFGRVQRVYAIAETESQTKTERQVSHPKETSTKPKFLAIARTESIVPLEFNETETDTSDLIWMDWTWFESGDESWGQAGGDGGNAYGRYQFDKRCWLGKFLTYCADMDPTYAGLAKYANANGTASDDGTLAEAWKWICYTQGEEFFQLQTNFALQEYYYPVKADLAELYQIDLDEYGPVLKGTVWSIAIRDGINVSLSAKTNRLKSVTETYYEGIDEAEWLNRIYLREAERHTADPDRWREWQKIVALEIYEIIENDDHESEEIEMLSESRCELLSW